MPVRIDGAITSLQSIPPDGQDKQFLPGGEVKGGSFTIGERTDATIMLLGEGYATMASVHEATGYQAVVAFHAGNLLEVATQLRDEFPSAVIVLCADNDLYADGKPNRGVIDATAASNAIKGVLAIPELSGTKCDFNDVACAKGLDAVSVAITAVLQRETHSRPAARTDGEAGLIKDLADRILLSDHFARDQGGQLYVFEQGVYRPHGGEWIARRVKALLLDDGNSKHWSSHRAREVHEFIRVDAPALWERPVATVLNLRNGLLDLSTRTLAPHAPSHLSSVQLPVLFDPAATCPQWDAVTQRVLPADCQTVPFELAASAMRGEVSDQKAVLLVGSGDNGKSTVLGGLVSFLGRENVSSLALQRLENDRFAVVRLLGKLANICADLPSDQLVSTSTFKALTGGDQLTAERKFQGSFEFSSFVRLLFSTNHYPQSKDASHAFFRRWFVVPFDVVLDPQEKILDLPERLAAPSELSGVLNRCLDALPGMIQRGGFTQNATTGAALMEFREMTDPLAAWLDHHTRVTPDGIVTRKDLAILYNAASDAAGRPPTTPKAFCAAVRRLRPTVQEAQRTVCGEVKHVFLGIELSAKTLHEETPSTSPASHHSHYSSQIIVESEARKEEREREEEKRLKRGNGVKDVKDVKPAHEPLAPCFTCRGTRFWFSIHGATVCVHCHPPLSESLVAGWIGEPPGEGAR